VQEELAEAERDADWDADESEPADDTAEPAATTESTPTGSKAQFYALYYTRFASGFGFVTLLTLLPTYINRFDPSGLVIGLFTSAVTIAQTVSIVPLAWSGDRYDKRTVLLAGLGLGVFVYALFAIVGSSLGFIGVRALQGVVLTATGLMSLALVGQLAPGDERANRIGTANAWRLAAGILGALTAGALFERAGFTAVYGVIVVLLFGSVVAVALFVDRDPTRIEGIPFTDLAVNRRILTVTSFRAQYAFAVTLVRTWVPIYAGVEAASGGLAYGATAVSIVIVAERLTNMLCQPYTGRISDRFGRAIFVVTGGTAYGLVALAVPFSSDIGQALGVTVSLPSLGAMSAAFLPLVGLNALLGIADSVREPASMALFADEGTDDGGVASSFGIRELVWRPGSILAPLLGGVLMADVSMTAVFVVGGSFAFTGAAAMTVLLLHNDGAAGLLEW
jgi:MFS family permease